MDFEVPVRKSYPTEWHEICWVSRTNKKECIEIFLVQWTFSKFVFVRNMHGHVEKMPFGAGTRRYVALLAHDQALIYNFYLPTTFIIRSNDEQAFKAC